MPLVWKVNTRVVDQSKKLCVCFVQTLQVFADHSWHQDECVSSLTSSPGFYVEVVDVAQSSGIATGARRGANVA